MHEARLTNWLVPRT